MAEILTVGLPTLAVLIGILVNNSRLSDLRAYMDARWDAERRAADERSRRLEDRLLDLAGRMDRLETRVDSLEKALLGKIEDVDNRLNRLEQRFGR
jgi:predicted nuclease with TOPRIM domain